MTELIDESLLNNSLNDELRKAGMGDDLDGERSPSGDISQAAMASVAGIFGQMRPEQLLVYAANMFYRARITGSPQYDPETSEVTPPKKRERLALAMGVLQRFNSSDYDYMPEVPEIRAKLNKIAKPEPAIKNSYMTLMSITARLVHDKRGAQWLMSPQSRIAVNGSEVADFQPQIWMIIQDSILQYLSVPQISDLYLSPMSPKNAGEILRRQLKPNASYKRSILKEILKRDGQPDSALSPKDDTDVRMLLKKLMHGYKLEMNRRRQKALGGEEEI